MHASSQNQRSVYFDVVSATPHLSVMLGSLATYIHIYSRGLKHTFRQIMRVMWRSNVNINNKKNIYISSQFHAIPRIKPVYIAYFMCTFMYIRHRYICSGSRIKKGTSHMTRQAFQGNRGVLLCYFFFFSHIETNTNK